MHHALGTRDKQNIKEKKFKKEKQRTRQLALRHKSGGYCNSPRGKTPTATALAIIYPTLTYEDLI